MIDINSIDLNLIKIFVVLLEERHVSRAAKRLRLTQPAVSMGLRRLRALFSDELFVRSRRDMVPTDRALRLGSQLQNALSMIRQSMGDEERFDPRQATGDIRISVKDYTELEHILVSPFGGFNGAVDDALAARGLKRNVRWTVGHFALGPFYIKDSDYLLTLPASIAGLYEELHGLRGFDPPLPIPSFSVNLYWHERIHRSPLHVWFRSLF
jgi:DNA-binding transcriptional LysR family regulator